MVTGVETAGLVLATIPLILAGLELYSNGIAVTKRYLRYRTQFGELVQDLRAEHTIYHNTIQILLIGVVHRRDMPEFLAQPCGDRWKHGKFEKKLKDRLGQTYQSYIDTIDKMNTAAVEFKDRLKLDATGKPQFTEAKTFKDHYKKLKFSLNKRDYNDLMDRLRQANYSLHRMTTQTISLEGLQDSHRTKRRSIPRYTSISEGAYGCYSALQSSWKCPCHSRHTVSLRLEPRMDNTHSEDESDDDGKGPSHHPFHVLLGYGHDIPQSPFDNPSPRPWYWEEMDIHLTLSKPTASSTSTQAQSSNCRRVRFASEYKEAVHEALKPVPNLQPIQDLCAAICQLQNPQRDICFELLAAEIGKQKYGIRIYPQKDMAPNPESWVTSSLKNILRDPKFRRQSRLRLGVTLASSVLQLHNTPWIEHSLEKENIVFLQRTKTAAYEDPFISRSPSRLDQNNQIPVPDLMSRIIRNQTLYSLGILLIEIWYGKTIQELHTPEDGVQDSGDPLKDAMARWNTADRLLNDLHDQAGAKYAEAVRRCLRCEFGGLASDLENLEFQSAVYKGVVSQLKENLDFLSTGSV